MNHTHDRDACQAAGRIRAPISAELPPELVTAVIDSREQLPLHVAPLKSIIGTLATGDYSVVGLESVIAIERKSLPDLIACVGQERERFDREVQRLLAYSTRAVVVEAAWCELERGEWRSKVTPAAATGSCLGWIAQGLPIVFAGTRPAAAKVVSRLLYIAARRRWREARALVADVQGERRLSRNAPPPETIHSFASAEAVS